MESVFAVLKNADFTEGRGPMLLHKIFSSYEAASDYIMAQPGIYGSKQGIDISLSKVNDWWYNGYQVKQMDVLDSFDVGKLASARREIKELKARLNELQSIVDD